MKRLSFLFLIIFFLLPLSSFSNPDLLSKGVKEIVLPNGMKFLLLRRTGAPLFSAYIQVRVGGMDETAGQTGIAHLLEHMAFKGTTEIGTSNYSEEKNLLAQIESVHERWKKANSGERKTLSAEMSRLIQQASEYVVKEEFSTIYLRNGGSDLNATTSQDLTSYFLKLPKSKLRLWAYLESQRLQDPVFREFYSERDVVREERRTRVDDSPFGKLYEALLKLVFPHSPYGRPTIGYAKDIQQLSATDLERFYKKFYVPSNMVGAIVGDIDLAETETILKEYFGPIPAGTPPQEKFIEDPYPTQSRRAETFAQASPAMMIGYQKPNLPHPDDFVFDVLEQILCEGRTSRFYRRLVDQEQLVQNVSCSPSIPGSRAKNMFFVYLSVNQGKSFDEILNKLQEEMVKVETEKVSEEELKKAKKNLTADWYYNLESNEDLAQMLSYFEAISGSWKYLLEHPKKIQAVGDEDLKRVVKKYLQPQRRSVAILKSKS